jgi:[protein-PII] uridylyltransferase
MEEVEIPREVRNGEISVHVQHTEDGSRVTVIAPDRVGLLADFAGMFALQRIAVRAARIWAQDSYGVSIWEVADPQLDAGFVKDKYDAIVEGRVDPAQRLRPADATELAPIVEVRADASDQATVLEVRAADRPGVVYLVCAALAHLDVAVRSAHVDTLGPQAVDVFYLQEAGAGVLSETRSGRRCRVRVSTRGARRVVRLGGCSPPSPIASPTPSRTSGGRAVSPRPTSMPPRARSVSRCSRPTSPSRWSRSSSARSRSVRAARRSAVR